MQERWFDVSGDGGVRLRAREIVGPSADARSLVLHHGLASSQRIWDLMLPALARRFRVVTYDARGHGLSAKPTSAYGFDHLRGDALAVIRAAATPFAITALDLVAPLAFIALILILSVRLLIGKPSPRPTAAAHS